MRRVRTSTEGIESMVLTLAHTECQARLEAGHSMRAVEAYIDCLPVAEEARRSLWQWAWGYGERPLPK